MLVVFVIFIVYTGAALSSAAVARHNAALHGWSYATAECMATVLLASVAIIALSRMAGWL